MNHIRRFSWTLLIVFAPVLLAGCGSSPASRFYLLSPVAEAPPAKNETAGNPGCSLGVGPIVLPSYLDRPQMARRMDDNQLEFAEFDRWAESLNENVSRVLIANLATLLPDCNVMPFPVSGSLPRPEYQVLVNVQRFEASPEKSAVLEARVVILESGTGQLLVDRMRRHSQPYEGSQWGAVVAAQSKCLELLSDDIASAVRELPTIGKEP